MIKFKALPLVFTLLLLTPGCVTVPMDEKHTARRTVSERFPAADAEKVRLKVYAGSLHVIQADTEDVTIEGEVTMRGARAEAVQRDSESLHFDTAYADDGHLMIKLPKPGRRYEADLVVTVPRDVALEIDLRYGNLVARLDAPQSTKIRLRAGDMNVRLPSDTAAHVVARATVGDVSVHGFEVREGRAKRKLLVGARYHGELGEDDPAGDLDLKVTTGSIDIRGTE